MIGRGQLTLCAWPAKDILDRGCTIRRQWQFLLHEMNHKTFAEWAKSAIMVADASEKAVVWIPYGWYAAAIVRPSETASAALMTQPCVSHTMARRCPTLPLAADFLHTFLQQKVSSNVGTFGQWAPQACEWLRSTSAAALSAVDAEPQAIEDDRKMVEPDSLAIVPVP